MPYITSQASDNDVNIYYQDCGEGEPVVLIHGWPLSHRVWERQINALTDAGYRCIAYDRRGFGDSDKPWNGYNYDTMTADLHELLTQLDIEDATLAGISMGSGEVARYIGNYGSDRISKAVLIASIQPYLLKTDGNPEGGMQQSDVDEMKQAVTNNRLEFLDDFGTTLVNWSEDNQTVSKALLDYKQSIANFASPRASQECITAFAETDFREDLKNFDLPTLIVHGTEDQIIPAEVSAKRSYEMIDDSRLELIEDGPHELNFTHPEKLNKMLIDFISC